MNSALMKKCLQTLKQNNTLAILKQSLSGENDIVSTESGSNGTTRRHLNTQSQPNQSVKQTNQPINEQIKFFLNANSIPFHKSWKSLNVLINCDTKSNTTESGIGKKNVVAKSQVYMNENSGDFLCLKCNKQGDWVNFKTLIQNRTDCSFCQKPKTSSTNLKSAQISIEQALNRKIADEWNQSRPIRSLSNTELMIINSLFQIDFKKETLEKYMLRFRESNIFFPVFDESNSSTLHDLIQLIPDENQTELIDQDSIYCLNLLDEPLVTPKLNMKNEIFVTDSILNSLVLYEAFGKPAIVINSISSVDFKVLAKLEPYDSIIFWQKDKNLSFELANLFNSRRCKLISYYRSAYESAVMKDSLLKIIANEAFTLNNQSIISFNHLKDKVYSEIANLNHLVGVQWKRFPPLNQILKGHRSGEFTIFTGPTGSGKTTFLSEYSIDLCESGVKTLWGSFEIKNHRLVKIMMTQFSKSNLYKNRNMFEHISSQFNKLPLYFMSFHGQETLENVLKTMSNAVVLYGIKHVIIDNLQFMVGNQFNSNMDRFSYQDLIIGRFRSFATNFDCHVTIVIHPRKEDGNEPLKISSIFGSAKSSQEADNIMILQDWDGKHIQISKNRFDGELGKIHLEFNKDNLCFRTYSKNRGRAEPSSTSKKSPIMNSNDLTNTNNEIDISDISSQIAN